jgi:membrane fusion protein (multidrug efflux system)
VDTAGADIAQAQAALAQAELDLSHTKIYAPEDGVVTKKVVVEGALLNPGQPLLAIVPDELYVTANFKETQLTWMRPGQPVEIKVDAYPGKVFAGKVDSVQAGSGAAFSLLPPENATGNYVKVVQRVPVKIVFTEAPDENFPLGPGMSVEPEVKVK